METRSKKQTDSKKSYDRKYRAEKLYCVSFRLSRVHEKDLIEKYNAIPNKMEWFRDCLREYEEK